MKIIQFKHPHRQKHFDFFNSMAQAHFSLCANIDITALKKYISINKLALTPTIVYMIAHAANSIPEFRQRIRAKNTVVEHDLVHPSFAVLTEVADVFSFCETKYTPNYMDFTARAIRRMELMKKTPSFEDDENRDDYLFLSAIPWVHFTGLTHAMHTPVQDSVPRITWGGFLETGEQIQMPLSVQVHHALVDGRHVGQFYQLFQKIAHNPADFLLL